MHPNQATGSIRTSLDEIVRDSLAQDSGYYDIGAAGRTTQGIPTAAAVASSLSDQKLTNRGTLNSQDQMNSATVDRSKFGEFSYNEEDLSQVDKDLIFEGLKQLYYKKVSKKYILH